MATNASISPYFDEPVRDMLLEIAAELREFRQHSAVRQEEIKQEQKIRLQEIQDQWEIWRREQVMNDIRHLFPTSSWSSSYDDFVVDLNHLFEEFPDSDEFAMEPSVSFHPVEDVAATNEQLLVSFVRIAALLVASTPNSSLLRGPAIENSWHQLLLKVLHSSDLPQLNEQLYWCPSALNFIEQIFAYHLFDKMPKRGVTWFQTMVFWPTGIGTRLQVLLWSRREADDFPFDGGGFLISLAHGVCLDFTSSLIKLLKFEFGLETLIVTGDAHNLFDERPHQISWSLPPYYCPFEVTPIKPQLLVIVPHGVIEKTPLKFYTIHLDAARSQSIIFHFVARHCGLNGEWKLGLMQQIVPGDAHQLFDEMSHRINLIQLSPLPAYPSPFVVVTMQHHWLAFVTLGKISILAALFPWDPGITAMVLLTELLHQPHPIDLPTSRRYEAAEWLRKMVGVVAAKDFPAEPSEEEFRLGLRSGMILCNVINKVQAGAVPKVVESPCDSALIPDGAALSAFQYFENVRNYLVAAQEIGLPTFEASDLEQGGKSARCKL